MPGPLSIYFAVVQSVFLYGSKTLVMTLLIGRVLFRFHHKVACRLTGSKPWRGRQDFLKEGEARVRNYMVITAYGTPFALVTSFKYLGRIITVADVN